MRKLLFLAALAYAAPMAAEADGVADFVINPATGHAINVSGSYRLTANVTMTADVVAIQVNADDVTLDLGGHTVTGSGLGGDVNGINIDDSIRVTVRNGTVSNFGGRGIDASSALDTTLADLKIPNCTVGVSAGDGAHLTNVTALYSAQDGIRTGFDALIERCIASYNCVIGAGHAGIDAGPYSVLRGCNATHNVSIVSNGDVYGIFVGQGSIVENCVAGDNYASNAGSGYGIAAGAGCVLTGNTCQDNWGPNGAGVGIYAADNSRVTGNTCNANSGGDGIGIAAVANCEVTDNICIGNATLASEGNGMGIQVGANSVARGNTANGNSGAGATGSAVGIRATESCRVEGNTCIGNTCAGGGTATGVSVDNACRVENNQCVSNFSPSATVNSSGIFVVGSGNFIRGNNTQANGNTGIKLVTSVNRVQENIAKEPSGISESGGNSIGIGDLANIEF